MSTIKIWLDPITRIEGHLAAYIEIDTTTTPPHVTTAYTSAMMLRSRWRRPAWVQIPPHHLQMLLQVSFHKFMHALHSNAVFM